MIYFKITRSMWQSPTYTNDNCLGSQKCLLALYDHYVLYTSFELLYSIPVKYTNVSRRRMTFWARKRNRREKYFMEQWTISVSCKVYDTYMRPNRVLALGVWEDTTKGIIDRWEVYAEKSEAAGFTWLTDPGMRRRKA